MRLVILSFILTSYFRRNKSTAKDVAEVISKRLSCNLAKSHLTTANAKAIVTQKSYNSIKRNSDSELRLFVTQFLAWNSEASKIHVWSSTNKANEGRKDWNRLSYTYKREKNIKLNELPLM